MHVLEYLSDFCDCTTCDVLFTYYDVSVTFILDHPVYSVCTYHVMHTTTIHTFHYNSCHAYQYNCEMERQILELSFNVIVCARQR